MYSATKRISMINQPHEGYLNKKNLMPIQLQDIMLLNDNENIRASLVGLAVDYMTKFMMDTTKEKACSISLNKK